MVVLKDKATTSKSYSANILMLDMSKAFDTVSRQKLLDILKTIIDADELHMVYLMLQNIELRVRCGASLSGAFSTNIGVPQGDALSPILFTLYLAYAMKPAPIPALALYPHIQPYDVARDTNSTSLFSVQLQYADDISWIVTNADVANEIKNDITCRLGNWNLSINNQKTELHHISRTSKEPATACKYLGTWIDSQKDIRARRTAALISFDKVKSTIQSEKVRLTKRVALFRALVEPIFLYNSETWVLNETDMKLIDAFQRRLLRRLLNVYWPNIMPNEEVMERTGCEAWSRTIVKRRLRLFGHILRLPRDTPINLAIAEGIRAVPMPPGRRKKTWLDNIREDLSSVGIQGDLEALRRQAQDRAFWKRHIR